MLLLMTSSSVSPKNIGEKIGVVAKKEGEKLPQITWDNEMFFSFAFCTFFKIFHVRLGKKSKSVSFSRVYVCVKAKLTLVSFFFTFFFMHLSLMIST